MLEIKITQAMAEDVSTIGDIEKKLMIDYSLAEIGKLKSWQAQK